MGTEIIETTSTLQWILSIVVFPLVGLIWYQLDRSVRKLDENLSQTKGELYKRTDEAKYEARDAKARADKMENGIGKDLKAIRSYIEQELKNAQTQKDYFEKRLNSIEKKVDQLIQNNSK